MNQTTNDILELLRKSDNPISDPAGRRNMRITAILPFLVRK